MSSIEIKEGGSLFMSADTTMTIDGKPVNPSFMVGKLNIEPKVWLTIEEAEYLTWLIHSLYDAVEMYDSFREGRYEQVKEGYDILCPRIAEAKGEQ